MGGDVHRLWSARCISNRGDNSTELVTPHQPGDTTAYTSEVNRCSPLSPLAGGSRLDGTINVANLPPLSGSPCLRFVESRGNEFLDKPLAIDDIVTKSRMSRHGPDIK